MTLSRWFAVFAGYAAVVAIVTTGPSRAWGAWATAGYVLAAAAAWRSRGPALPLLTGACGAVAAPTIWLAAGWQPGGEPAVVARAASLLVHHGSPYLQSGQLLSAQSYNPYLPAMSVFGFPYAAGLPGLLGNPASWMAVTTLALIAAAIGVGLPPRHRHRAFGTGLLLRNLTLAVVTPVLALPIDLGTTDPPVIALMCLALACASRSGEVRPTLGRPTCIGPRPWGAAARWITWNGLAALAIGTACAMKATAWPALPVIAAMIAAREGPRAAARFAGAAAAAAAVLAIALAPELIAHPDAFADNIIAYPLGLARHLTTAASPLPGHLLANAGAPGRLAALGLLLAGAIAVAMSLGLRPPRDARAAAVRLALGLTMLFTLAPDARFGYFAYPAALLGWVALTGSRAGRSWTDHGTARQERGIIQDSAYKRRAG
ncbi:MAG TPA: glycosyltransferase 87 family protein [Trebonia sp.]|nr:glycosyltransferase 87 family protein [Trebonia sp.]